MISKKELKLFYTAFLDAGRLGDKKLSELTEVSYSAMTSNGDVQLSFHMFFFVSGSRAGILASTVKSFSHSWHEG